MQFTLLRFLSTLLLRSSSWLVTRLATTRSNVLFPVTFSLPSVTMRSMCALTRNITVFYLTLSPRLHKLLGDVVISQGGVVPFIQPELLPSATK
jgi:hypothetical protein